MSAEGSIARWATMVANGSRSAWTSAKRWTARSASSARATGKKSRSQYQSGPSWSMRRYRSSDIVGAGPTLADGAGVGVGGVAVHDATSATRMIRRANGLWLIFPALPYEQGRP